MEYTLFIMMKIFNIFMLLSPIIFLAIVIAYIIIK